MKNLLLFLSLFCCTALLSITARAEDDAKPEPVKTGVYITSIHDIDFKQKEYTIGLWMWFKYKNQKFDFLQNLEIPMAKAVTKSFSTTDTIDGEIYLLMKLQCVMKDSWKINNFPFDRQKLRFSVENSQFDSKALVFVVDTSGKHFDPRFTLRGWTIDSLKISVGKRVYETGFGDAEIKIPHTEYSNFKVNIGIDRDAVGLFWKMFLGMYVAFFIAYMCFFIHTDGIDSRFGLSVGALFAVVGNKYIVDASLPESTTFTLVDMLHGITLFFILTIIASNAYSLKLVKKEKIPQALRFDKVAAVIILIVYIALNTYFIWDATSNT